MLSDPDKRAKYDQFGHAAFDPSYGGGAAQAASAAASATWGDLGDLSATSSAAASAAAVRSAATHRSAARIHPRPLFMSFEEAAFGCEKEINVDRVEPVADCGGTGCAPGTTPEVCPDCRGTGVVRTPDPAHAASAWFQTQGACPNCRGTGKIIHQPCPRCGGRGAVRKNQTIKVKIPAGIDDGQTLNLRGKGNAGLDGGPAGDLLITVFVKPHPFFERDGNSVLMEMPVTFAQAALGAEIEVPTIDGRVEYKIPEGTQTGTTFRMRGKGKETSTDENQVKRKSFWDKVKDALKDK